MGKFLSDLEESFPWLNGIDDGINEWWDSTQIGRDLDLLTGPHGIANMPTDGPLGYGRRVMDDVVHPLMSPPKSGDLRSVGEAGLQMGMGLGNLAMAGASGIFTPAPEGAKPGGYEHTRAAADAVRRRTDPNHPNYSPYMSYQAESPGAQSILRGAGTLIKPFEDAKVALGEQGMKHSPEAATGLYMLPDIALALGLGGAKPKSNPSSSAEIGNFVKQTENLKAGNRLPPPMIENTGRMGHLWDDAKGEYVRDPFTGPGAKQAGAIRVRDPSARGNRRYADPEVEVGPTRPIEEILMGGVRMAPIENPAGPGGWMKPAAPEAIKNAPGVMTGKGWRKWLNEHGISGDDIKFTGIGATLAGREEASIKRTEMEEALKNSKDYVTIRRSGEGVGKSELQIANDEARVERNRILNQTDRVRQAASSKVSDVIEDLGPENKSILVRAMIDSQDADTPDDAMESFRELSQGKGISPQLLEDMEPSVQEYFEASAKAEEARRNLPEVRRFQPEWGGDAHPSYMSDYKASDSVMDYLTTFTMPTEPYGRGEDVGASHYSAPGGEYILKHNRLSRRILPDSMFEGEDGNFYDETVTHLDEDQSDLHRHANGYGRPLTEQEAAQFKEYNAKRAELNDQVQVFNDKIIDLKNLKQDLTLEMADIPNWNSVSLKRALELQVEMALGAGLMPTRKIEDFQGSAKKAIDIINDERQALLAEASPLITERDNWGLKAAQVAEIANKQTPDTIQKDRLQRRADSIINAINDAVKRGDEYATVATWQQQGEAYDQMQQVGTVRFDPDADVFVDEYGQEIAESELLRYADEEEIDDAKNIISEDDYYLDQREIYVDSEYNAIYDEILEVERYKDRWGDEHESRDDALDEDDPEFEPEDVDGAEYEGDFYEGYTAEELAQELADKRVPDSGDQIKLDYDYDGYEYNEYLNNTGGRIEINDNIIVDETVAGTAHWYKDDFNNKAIDLAYEKMGVERPELNLRGALAKEIDTDYGGDTPLAIRITPEIIDAINNQDVAMFNRWLPKGRHTPRTGKGREARRTDSMPRREDRRAGKLFGPTAELYSSFPRGSVKHADPRPELGPENPRFSNEEAGYMFSPDNLVTKVHRDPTSGRLFEPLPEGRLRGAPETVYVPGKGEKEYGIHKPASDIAREYTESKGMEYTPSGAFAKVDPKRAKKVAHEYEIMPHDPSNPEVKASYGALAEETLDQFKWLMDKTDLKIDFNYKYDQTRDVIDDVIDNNHMSIFSTKDGYGEGQITPEDLADNPLLAETEFTTSDGQPLLVNDIFRIVHDYFGHVKNGVGFRARGEENAWQAHAAMYSPLARRAMTTETRGQNSWVNYGPEAEHNRTASPEDTRYAEQKIGLMPNWVSEEGRLSATDRRRRYQDARRRGETGFEGSFTDDGRVQLYHYSRESFDRTDPSKWGDALSRNVRSEMNIKGIAPGRTYFGLETKENPYKKETGLGSKKYSTTVDPELLYNPMTDPEGLWQRDGGNNIIIADNQQRLKDAGYVGYWINHPELGKVVVIFDEMSVTEEALFKK